MVGSITWTKTDLKGGRVKEMAVSSVKKLSKIGFLAVCMKGKTLIHTSGYPNLYTAEVELYNLSHICY